MIGKLQRAMGTRGKGELDVQLHALQVALAACIGEYCGAAPDDDAAQMLHETALQDPLPAAPPLSTVHAVVLPVICRAHADRLQALGLLDAAIAAAVRMSRHKEFATKVASVRAFGRLVAWAARAGCKDAVVPPLVGVVHTTLAPDQDRALQAVRTIHRHAAAPLQVAVKQKTNVHPIINTGHSTPPLRCRRRCISSRAWRR